jgi:hypothetical protein
MMMAPAAVMAAVEAARTAMARRRHAHACNCGDRRNENLVDLHVVTSFF